MLSGEDRELLHIYGFSPREIRELDEAKDPAGKPQPTLDIRNSPAWQSVLFKRLNLIDKLNRQYKKDTGKKLTRHKRLFIINTYYTSGEKKSPFDWLKDEYRRLKKAKIEQDSIGKAKALAHKRIMNWKRRVRKMV
jgi:hypothetical protein